MTIYDNLVRKLFNEVFFNPQALRKSFANFFVPLVKMNSLYPAFDLESEL